MLTLGVIEPSDAEWSFPIWVVSRQDGYFPICVDDRHQNERAIKDVYPALRIDDCMVSLINATVFFTLGCNTVYWQVSVAF